MHLLTWIEIILTILVYIGARFVSQKVKSPLTTPIFTSTAVIILIFLLCHISYKAYSEANRIISSMLGPVTVALAVPIYQNRKLIRKRMLPAAAGLLIGTISTILTAVWFSIWLGLPEKIQATAAVKAVSTPVAIQAALLIGGDPSLAAAFVITAGIIGAVFGPFILSKCKITDPFSRGLGIGTVSHAIGTSQAGMEGPIEGAASSAAMGLAAMITAIILPWLYPLIS
ncbi:LrgB family protein [Falsibacillus pallidus]|uniref:Putative murein hydrolase (TIGR00659 family) n=1 Tax=Falsibacillus pallidus TaxID=493781 RepID=A0A370GPN7_9BACI|nr:LrgB family protein [Falsibacillus pallidus]RDI45647.1 putative murein hydrolase (TIGR00659 family) [Falsibacillus pallidus]